MNTIRPQNKMQHVRYVFAKDISGFFGLQYVCKDICETENKINRIN